MVHFRECLIEVRDQSFLLTRLRRLRHDRDTVLPFLQDLLFCWRGFSNAVSVSDFSNFSSNSDALASAKDEGLLPVRESVHACMAQIAGFRPDMASMVCKAWKVREDTSVRQYLSQDKSILKLNFRDWRLSEVNFSIMEAFLRTPGWSWKLQIKYYHRLENLCSRISRTDITFVSNIWWCYTHIVKLNKYKTLRTRKLL